MRPRSFGTCGWSSGSTRRTSGTYCRRHTRTSSVRPGRRGTRRAWPATAGRLPSRRGLSRRRPVSRRHRRRLQHRARLLLGASRAGRDSGRADPETGSDRSRIALAYVDGHADFASPEESMTGSVASMGLALAVGRGDTQLARLAGPVPLVRGDDVALIGRRAERAGVRPRGACRLGHPRLAVGSDLARRGGCPADRSCEYGIDHSRSRRERATRAGSGSSSMPTCSAPRSCPRSGRPSLADRTSTTWQHCSRHWSTTRRRSAWRSRSTTPHSTRIDRPGPGWWSCAKSLLGGTQHAAPA